MWCATVGGGRGAKRPDQGESVLANQAPDTVPGTESIWTTLNGHEARNRGHSQEAVPTPIPNACKLRWNGYGRQSVCASAPEVGAQCGSSARWDLCGGRRATGVPTAKVGHRTAWRLAQSNRVRHEMLCKSLKRAQRRTSQETLVKTCMPKPVQTRIVQSSLNSQNRMSCPGAYGVREYGRYSAI